MLSCWVGVATGLALNLPTTNMGKVARVVGTACRIKFPTNDFIVSRIYSCVRPDKRLIRGGGLGGSILLGFGFRHESDLMQMGRAMTPWETISGLKLTKFIIELQDTCPFILSCKLHYLDSVGKIITHVSRSWELAGK